MCRRAAALVLTLLGAPAISGAPPPDATAMLKRADAPHDAFPEGLIRMRVVVDERGKPPVDAAIDLFVKGTDESLCVFREGKQKGRKILTLADHVWLIVPGASRSIPVSKTQRLMGAASFGDIARLRFADEYTASLRQGESDVPGSRGDTPCRVLDLKARRAGSAYPTAVLWTGRDDGLARRLRLSLASGKEAKDVLFTGYRDDLLIETMEIRDLLSKGGEHVTTLRFESYERRPLDPKMFGPEGAREAP
jgi:outer membrane lipoprotein-sorting protein